MTTLEEPGTAIRTITAEIDGHTVTVPEGTTIYDAAKAVGVDIPVLCHNERYDPVGVCRMCVVDTGGRVFAAACVRPCEDGMTVKTDTPELNRSRSTLTELLVADQPPRAEDPKQNKTGDNLLLELADRFDVARETTELPCGTGRGADSSNPVIDVNHDACILCDRCVRACDDIQGNDVIGRSGKGYSTRIAFDFNDPMGNSSCVTCGECVQACPTGALTNKPINLIPIRPREELDAVDTVRQGPVRLGLRGLAAAPDRAADPQGLLVPEGAAVRGRARRHGRGRRQRPRPRRRGRRSLGEEG